jgi:hypothetical protein
MGSNSAFLKNPLFRCSKLGLRHPRIFECFLKYYVQSIYLENCINSDIAYMFVDSSGKNLESDLEVT